MVQREDVAYISAISSSSPYLLISFILLTWNIIFTSKGREVICGFSLAFSPILGIAILVIKYHPKVPSSVPQTGSTIST